MSDSHLPSRPIEMRVHQRAITPFWRKLPFIFGFPFRSGPLIFLICMVLASALAGLILGPFGLVFRGILIYLGLRYGFNVLDLFRKGRFEGESPDHSLWGTETRPGKLGLVLAIFIAIGATVGNIAVQSRLDNDPKAQQLLLDRYKATHATEIAALAREREESVERAADFAEERARYEAQAKAEAEGRTLEADDPETRARVLRARLDAEKEARAEIAKADDAEYGRSRADILRDTRPEFGHALWWRLLPAWFWPLMVVLSFILPAATLVIAIDDEFFRALNPGNVPYFIRAMGSAYFVLWAFFLAIAGSRHLVLTIGAHWPSFVRLPVEMGLGTYLALVLCALLGYVIYQFHQELHLEVDVDFATHREAGGAEAIARAGSAGKAVQAASTKSPLERQVQQLVAAGKIKEAIDEVKDEMRYDRLDADLNDLLHSLYMRLGQREQTLAHGQQWLKALVRADRMKPAHAALTKLRRIDEHFLPHDPDCVVPLARRAIEARETDLAAALLNGFDKRFPEHRDLPQVYFLGARVLAEHRGEPARAVALLQQLLERHGGDAVAEEARAYLDRLQGGRAQP